MRNVFLWILFLILPCLVTSQPVRDEHITIDENVEEIYDSHAQNMPEPENTSPNEKVISVRITSSVAVGRGKSKTNQKPPENNQERNDKESVSRTDARKNIKTSTIPSKEIATNENVKTDMPPDLTGANIEFIKQLNAKKEARGLHNLEQVHPFQLSLKHQHNETDDSIAESSIKSVLEIFDKNDENIENVPLARSVSLSTSSNNYIQGLTPKPLNERGSNPRLTTVSFNIVHDTPEINTNLNEPTNAYINPSETFTNFQQFYNKPPKMYLQPAQVYSEPAKFYSEPAKVYSEPAKVYSEPAKIYSEPAKVYSDPAKVYSDPAKIYSEPAKFYSQPASLHLSSNIPPNHTPWNSQSQTPTIGSTIISTTPLTRITNPSDIINTQKNMDHQPEKNYEVDEKVSVLTDGRSHGVQESSTEKCKQDNCKVGYVVEGRQYRKYRVEERTKDGFIVGEYGVVRNEDGALRGVRYTADSDASPRLIYDALMKFLQLK